MDVDHHAPILRTATCSLFQLIQNDCCPSLAKAGNADLGFSGLGFSCVHFCRGKVQRWLGHSFRAKLLLLLQGDIPFW